MQSHARLSLVCASVILTGCHANENGELSQEQRRNSLDAILASALRVRPEYSQLSYLEKSDVPIGIQLAVEATDPQGESAKATGQLILELYRYRMASADPKGELLYTWSEDFGDRGAQQSYWNHRSRMYHIPLELSATAFSGQPRFIIVARLSDVWNEHIEDQKELDFRRDVARIKREVRSSAQQ